MRVAALQTDILWEDPPGNFARLTPWLERAAAAGARLITLPEMYACGFSMATERTAEPPGGPSTDFLVRQARRLGCWLAGSLPERAPGAERPTNTLLVAGPGGELHRYAKLHPFTYAGEQDHFEAGSERVTVSIEGVRFSLFVCYDLRFADEFWAVAPETDAYLVVANWPETRRHHWVSLATARAIENQAYVVAVNRVGEGGRLVYVGDSRIVDPMGETLASASRGETMLLAEVDPAVVAETRARLPFLKDRR
ncbi:MAG TPA: carbon-nitrogen family hydrolase [Thermoanaerobaculia bacterium]|nr:carbon-nitrogen family hydrolase [Thermoanaerobaculia bacterium]